MSAAGDLDGPRRDRGYWLILLAVIVAAAMFLLPSLHAPGKELDEGALVTYPSEILQGAVPYRDFETFYGPAGPYLVAAAFELTAPRVEVERIVGLLLRLLLVGAVFALVHLHTARRTLAVLAAMIATGLLATLGPGAFAAVGALAFGLWSLWCLFRARRADGGGPPRPRAAFGGGFLFGIAALFRPEFAAAILIASVPILWRGRARFAGWALGAAIGLLPYVIVALIAGGDALQRVLEDLGRSGDQRSVPLPALTTLTGFAFLVFALVTLAGLIRAILGWRRGEDRPLTAELAAVSLAAAALAPYYLSRAEITHLVPFGIVASIAASYIAYEILDKRPASNLAGRALGVAASLTVAAAIVAGIVGLATDRMPGVTGYHPAASFEVRNGDRSFPVDDSIGPDLQRTLDTLAEVGQPGDRLFVGDTDFRYASYNDVFVYFLFPDLEPASVFLELNPGGANGPQSALEDDLASADFLLLSDRFVHDPSEQPGPEEPSRIVNRDFCTLAQNGAFVLLGRCEVAPDRSA